MVSETIALAGLILIVIGILGSQKIRIKEVTIGDLSNGQRAIVSCLGIIVLIASFWTSVPFAGPVPSNSTPIPTVIPTPIVTSISSPTLTLSPKPPPTPFKIEIIIPTEGGKVQVYNEVSGTVSGEIEQGQYMWVVINPNTNPGQWWPQGGRIDPLKGQWKMTARFGRENMDVGVKFDLAVILVNEKDNQYYVNYLETGQKTGSYPGIPLPDSAKTMDRITVIRI